MEINEKPVVNAEEITKEEAVLLQKTEKEIKILMGKIWRHLDGVDLPSEYMDAVMGNAVMSLLSEMYDTKDKETAESEMRGFVTNAIEHIVMTKKRKQLN